MLVAEKCNLYFSQQTRWRTRTVCPLIFGLVTKGPKSHEIVRVSLENIACVPCYFPIQQKSHTPPPSSQPWWPLRTTQSVEWIERCHGFHFFSYTNGRGCANDLRILCVKRDVFGIFIYLGNMKAIISWEEVGKRLLFHSFLIFSMLLENDAFLGLLHTIGIQYNLRSREKNKKDS